MPQDRLSDAIQLGFAHSQQAHERRLAKPAIRERFETPGAKRQAKFENKEPSEYNCNDLEPFIRQLWAEHKLPGQPFRFTRACRKQAKEMIDDQGAEAVVACLRYVFAHWEALQRRYGAKGAPCIRTVYAYRRSWFPESVTGPVQQKKLGGAEYTGSEPEPKLSEEEMYAQFTPEEIARLRRSIGL